jgi:hypothetical protein
MRGIREKSKIFSAFYLHLIMLAGHMQAFKTNAPFGPRRYYRPVDRLMFEVSVLIALIGIAPS